MSKFTIDFFELMFLAEVCIPQKPIARAMLWIDLCDVHYHNMSENERLSCYKWLLPKLNTNEDCEYFKARFDPDNQFEIMTNFENKTSKVKCFKWNGEYHTSKNTFINQKYIIR